MLIAEASALGFAALAILGQLLSGGRLRGRLNPVTVYGAVWAVLLLVYPVSALSAQRLSVTVVGFFFAAYGAFIVGSTVCSLSGRAARNVGRTMVIDRERLAKAYRIALGSAGLYTLLQIVQVLPLLAQAGGIKGLLTGGGLAFRRSYLQDRLTSVAGGLSGSGAVVAVLGYILFLGFISLVWAGYYASTGEFKLALAPIGLVLVYSLLTLQRASFVYAFGIFAFSWYYFASLRDRRVPERRTAMSIRIGALGGIFLVAVAVPTLLRSQSSTGADTTGGILQYLESGIAGFNANYLADQSDPLLSSAATGAASPFAPAEVFNGPMPTTGHGVWTFQGIVSIVDRLGFTIQTPPQQFNYLRTSGTTGLLSNTYTHILYFYYDFGWAGVIGLSVALGYLATFAHQRARSGSVVAIPAASVLMTTVMMLFFGLSLVRDFRYAFLIGVSPIIMRLICVSRPDPLEVPPEHLATSGPDRVSQPVHAMKSHQQHT